MGKRYAVRHAEEIPNAPLNYSWDVQVKYRGAKGRDPLRFCNQTANRDAFDTIEVLSRVEDIDLDVDNNHDAMPLGHANHAGNEDSIQSED